ncbi:MAG: DUF2309 family protein, partial [Verrucomicrobia bacterium]|nr:DUF2309 family protein [Verrucomicrobiota bacterium]
MINTYSLLPMMDRYAASFCLLAPLPLILMFFIPTNFTRNKKRFTVSMICWLSRLSGLFVVIASFFQIITKKAIIIEFLAWGPIGLTLYFDMLSAIMLLLVAFLTISIITFSCNYLAGNPNQGLFFKWLAVTSGSVFVLIISGNLALFTLAWVAVSLSLHKLLTFYKDRDGAKLAARKKFLFSRWGDLALLTAIVIIWHDARTLDFSKLFSIAQNGSFEHLEIPALLLVGAAMIKSAQFPFHGWLPDTMETPTPVSALMHAGIINAGGFLVIRLSPLLVLNPRALELLAGVGGFTALFASVVMITQSNIKRSLAFSTIAQMGFMMLQCGLGAFALALLHIIAHSLYKAFAFLSSGKAIDEIQKKGTPPPPKYIGFQGTLLCFLTSIVITVGFSLLLGMHSWDDSGRFSLTLILIIAIAQFLFHFWSLEFSGRSFLIATFISSGLTFLFFMLHAGAEGALSNILPAAPVFKMAWPIGIMTALSFLIIALRAFLPSSWVQTSLGKTLFVHAYNGFYIHTRVNRLITQGFFSLLYKKEKSPLIINPTYSRSWVKKIESSTTNKTPTEFLINNAIAVATKRLAPLWPLSRFVAVNPFVGLAAMDFSEAASFLKKTRGIVLSMPFSFYRERYEAKIITDQDLYKAIKEVANEQSEIEKIFLRLHKESFEKSEESDCRSEFLWSSFIDARYGTRWSAFATEEISKWCVSFFDQGQALWSLPWKNNALFSAWKEAASIDCNLEVAGIKGWRKFVRSLPEDPVLVIQRGVSELRIREEETADIFYALLASVGGWAGYLQFLSHEKNLRGEKENSLIDLLAIRIVHELAICDAFADFFRSESFALEREKLTKKASLTESKALWQRAHECAMERKLFKDLALATKNREIKQPCFQAVFCIDVRSEIYRRSLEQVIPDIQTIGFAGFFGFPIDVIDISSNTRRPQSPVLIKPNVEVFESLAGKSELIFLKKKILHAWSHFKSSAVSSFVFVELVGIGFLFKMMKNLLHRCRVHQKISNHQISIDNISLEKQVAMAAGALQHMGFAKGGLARIVLLCGHGSQSENNPYASSLDCGACGGHSGEVNARTAAMILNSHLVREKLAQQGIFIPAETFFVAGLHNTTRDEVILFDESLIPVAHQKEIEILKKGLLEASTLTRRERAPLLGVDAVGSQLTEYIYDRSVDWSQVRPEWGLAGNYAFIAAPRKITRDLNLRGRVFLHDYNYHLDESEITLEVILSAPVVVASWINLQYYASTICNKHFGSGDKTLHHVSGLIGIIEGN